MGSNSIIKIKNIRKVYGKSNNQVVALDGVSLEIGQGEFLGIMGASGSGKSTLLNCISTIDRVTSGNIEVDGINLENLQGKELSKFRREKVGFIFQDYNLLNTLNGFENISLPLQIRGENVNTLKKEINEVSKSLNIEDILSKFPYQMSGGQQQRVAAARAIMSKSSILIADEPTGSLDSNSSNQLLGALQELNKIYGITIVMVTHDVFTARFCSRIVFIKDGKIKTGLIKNNMEDDEFINNIIEMQKSVEEGNI